jgi:hypothetical protein
MGFFSKIWKGVKNGVKKIGKGIKSAFKKFGKFMNKIGVLGQIAMFFVMPYVGQALGSLWTGVAGQTAAQATTAAVAANTAVAAGTATAAQATLAASAAGTAVAAGGQAVATGLMAGATGGLAQATGNLMQYVGNVVSKGMNVYSNITKGITDTLGNFAKTTSNNLFGTSFDAASSFFGPGDSAWSRSTGVDSRFADLTGSQAKFAELKAARKADFNAAVKKTTAESSNPLAYNQTEFRPNSVYDQAIKDGTTNFSASTDAVLAVDPAALAEQAAAGVQEVAAKSVETITPEKSLLSRAGTAIRDTVKDLPTKAVEAFEEFSADPFAGTGDRFISTAENRVYQEMGLAAKPEYVTNYTTNAAYVPSFESFGSQQQQFGASEIMNARSFEQNVTNNPSPYGYTAFQYGNYMSQNA